MLGQPLPRDATKSRLKRPVWGYVRGGGLIQYSVAKPKMRSTFLDPQPWTRCSRARLATRSAAGVFRYYNNHIRVRILFSWAGVTHVARAYQRRLDRFTHTTVRVGTCIRYSGTAPRSVGPRLRLFVVCTSSALSSAPTTAAAPPSCTSPGAVAATSTVVGSATVCRGAATPAPPGTGKGESKALAENEFQPGKVTLRSANGRPMRDEATDSSHILLAPW